MTDYVAPLRHRALIVGLAVLIALPFTLLGALPPCEVQGNSLAPREIEKNVAFFQSADSIVTGPATFPVARDNRVYSESRLIPVLPSGRIDFDRAAELKSGQIWAGLGTTLKQNFTNGEHPYNSVLMAFGSGSNWNDPFVHGPGKVQITTSVAGQIAPGSVIFLWTWDTHPTGQQTCQRRSVVARSGNVLTLDGPVMPAYNRVKFFVDAAAIADVQETSSTVTVSRNIHAFPVGSTVLITSGPSLGNECAGELRKVISVSGNGVYVDRPLRRRYVDAALVRLGAVNGVTIRDCTIDQPVNPDAESIFAKFAVGWTFHRCRISRLALGNCAEFRFIDCEFTGRVQLTTCHDCTFTGCRLQSIAFEEDCRDNVVESCRIGPAGNNQNCVSLIVGSERLTERGSHLLGGGIGSSQLYGGGRECVYESLRLSGRAPCWISGGVRLSGVVSDGEINHTGGGALSASQVRATNWP